MSKKRLPLIALFTLGVAGFVIAGCHAEAKVGSTEPKAATPPPPPPPDPPKPPPPPDPPKPAPPALKAMGKAKIVGNQIQVPGKIHFALDKATIDESKQETKDVLDSILKTLQENPQITKVRIEGNTDDKGTLEHNAKLSQDRADAVSNWLVGKGIDKGRLATVGFGPKHTLVPNDSDDHRDQNRRVDFTIWEMDSKPTDAQKNAATSDPPGMGANTSAAPAATTTTATKPPAPKK
jgi:outer membrane protein OmpA-like peptidoglycan-associated protein